MRSRLTEFNETLVSKKKTAYEIKECDWSSDVCSSDLCQPPAPRPYRAERAGDVGCCRQSAQGGGAQRYPDRRDPCGRASWRQARAGAAEARGGARELAKLARSFGQASCVLRLLPRDKSGVALRMR